LAQVLKKLPVVTDPNVLVDIATSDDAAVYKIADDVAVVLTVDFFTPIVDDPYDFGRIAVTNALSDIYAMGAAPVVGLNLVAFPASTLPLDILNDIVRGGADQAALAGVSVVGGHSIDDPEPKYGMVALGVVNPNKVVTNSTARAGDLIFLTKPIGTGIISTAIKKELAPPKAIEAAIKQMTTLNKAASEAMQRVKVNACTDVTGFGLLGHLSEMTRASRTGAIISLKDVPVIPGVLDLLAKDMAPGGAYRNLDYIEGRQAVSWDGQFSDEDKILLCDPQTAGGLLISVSPEKSDDLKKELSAAGVTAAVIGKMTEDSEGRIHIT
jgi:selenide, water dikinase